MTPAEFRAAIDWLGFSQEGAGRWLGVSGRQGQRYATGEAKVPGPVGKLLYVALRYGLKRVDLAEAQGWAVAGQIEQEHDHNDGDHHHDRNLNNPAGWLGNGQLGQEIPQHHDHDDENGQVDDQVNHGLPLANASLEG